MSDSDTGTLKYRPSIDGLRGLAVILVVIYHGFPQIRTGGFVGVDVFFVISGYLITQLIVSRLAVRQFSLAQFYRRRVRRIVPALIVVVATTTLAAWFLLLPGELQWYGRSLAWCCSFLANVFFATTGGYFARAAGFDPLLHLWSLGVEEQFYIAWPLFILIASKYGFIKRTLGIAIIGSLTISVWGGWYAPTHYFYYPDSRGWELAVGGLLGALHLESSGRRLGQTALDACSILGLLLIAAGGIFWNSRIPIPGAWSLLPVSGAALLIGAGECAAANRWFLRARPMLLIGRISYPLYLWHWPLFAFTRIVTGHQPGPVTALAECAVALVAALATYRWIELPIRHSAPSRALAWYLLAGLLCFGLIGAAMSSRMTGGRLHGPTIAAWDDAIRDWRFPGPTNLGRTPRFGVTSLASRGPGKAVFIGDSHMEQYWPRAETAVRNHMDTARSIAFITQTGCPALPGVNAEGRGRKCNEAFQFALEQALQDGVDAVVFASFWENYFLGEFSSDKVRPNIYRITDAARSPLTIDSEGARMAFADLEGVITTLIAHHRRVYIILSNPTSPRFDPLYPPRLRFSSSPIENGALGAGPVVDVRAYEQFVAVVMKPLLAIAARTGARILDPREYLCDEYRCAAWDSNGMPRYIDSNHLRADAAREHAAFIDGIILDHASETVVGSSGISQLPFVK
jgi:peptidoglycan/LPS O-acetylase OafA/YrhL